MQMTAALFWCLLSYVASLDREADRARHATEPRVGPSSGSVLLVGGGAQSPSLFRTFIERAGGPDALIIDIPTAGFDSATSRISRDASALRLSGARNVVVLHTFDRAVANSDSIRALFARARGVWFGGGRQGRLVDAYVGTAVEQGLHDVLIRGGIVGGTSAGASILASFLVRGSPGFGDGVVYDGYTKGFGLLRETAVDQHAAVRARLRDLPDTVLRRHPELLGIALDEGAALLVRGDTATVVGRSNVFVYGRGVEPSDAMPYRLLRIGETFDLGARTVMSDDRTRGRIRVDSLFPGKLTVRHGMRAVLLASMHGRIVVASTVGTTTNPDALPATSMLRFRLGQMSHVVLAPVVHFALCDGVLAASDRIGANPAMRVDTAVSNALYLERHRVDIAELIASRIPIDYAEFVQRKLLRPLGMLRTVVAGTSGEVDASADDLLRLAFAFDDWSETHAVARAGDEAPCNTAISSAMTPWKHAVVDGYDQYTAESREAGASHQFVRVPQCRIWVLMLTDDVGADMRGDVRALVRDLLKECPVQSWPRIPTPGQ